MRAGLEGIQKVPVQRRLGLRRQGPRAEQAELQADENRVRVRLSIRRQG